MIAKLLDSIYEALSDYKSNNTDDYAHYGLKALEDLREQLSVHLEVANEIEEMDGILQDPNLKENELAVAAACWAVASLPGIKVLKATPSKGRITFTSAYPWDDVRAEQTHRKQLTVAAALIMLELERLTDEETEDQGGDTEA